MVLSSLRIVFFSSSSTSSGGTRQALYTIQELSKLGHNTAFIIPKGATIINKCSKTNWIELPKDVKKWKTFFKEFIDSFNPSIIHVYHNKAIKRMAWWSLFFKQKNMIILAHRGVVFVPNNPFPYWSPGIDCFTVNSLACAKTLKKIGVPKRKIKLLYNSIPRNRVASNLEPALVREKIRISKTDVVIGSISGDASYKGVDILLKAASLLKVDNWRLILIGPQKEKWTHLISRLKIEKKVCFLGHINNIADYLQIMDIFCIPSLSESMPNTLLEAIFAGLPIVSSKVGGIPEVLEGRGFLFKPGDFKQLALYLEQLITSESLREEIKSKIIPLQKLFLPEVKTQKLLNIYKELLQKNNG
ncbi:MAG: hypothetical protein PWR24_504 [Desulfonauticus sp.]|jgi:glycosyltransferase involved in cell wall biosynthesis|nr:MAG: Glycosyl transferases group 1 family protein [Desulfonauticus sp. 38_4375]MDK2920947.1 hypothetical protein [Desulfonauticus sp.]